MTKCCLFNRLQANPESNPSSGQDVLLFSVNARKPGTYTDAVNLSALTEGVQFSEIQAVYVCGGFNNVATFPYQVKNLGMYRHSQYNTPNESDPTCQAGGSKTNVCFTTPQCTFTTGTLFTAFKSKVDLNGSGISISHGSIQPESFCKNPPTACAGLKSYRTNVTIVPTCTGLPLNNTTVARNPNHPDLGCGDKVCIVGAGTNNSGIVKTVTDRCPGCVTKQLDNYLTSPVCSGIVDLGNFITLKIPQ